MARAPITALIPPPLAGDARVRALLQAFGSCLDGMEDRALILLDPATAPQAALPALTYEHSLDEFVAPDGLSVDVIRDLIDRAWALHEPKGYAEGVEGGVAMLGYPATLTQWWQATPRMPRGTHTIDVRTDAPLRPGLSPGPGTVRAIWRMIHAMQRWSQDHAVRLVHEAPVEQRMGVAVITVRRVQIEPLAPEIPVVSTTARAGTGVIVSRALTITGWIA